MLTHLLHVHGTIVKSSQMKLKLEDEDMNEDMKTNDRTKTNEDEDERLHAVAKFQKQDETWFEHSQRP